MKKLTFLLACILLYCKPLFAAYTDSLLEARITIPKPYLIVNLVASDCIVCKSNVAGLIKKTCKSKIIVLSDDKSMKQYLQRNLPELGTLPFVCDKVLSQNLALGARSTAVLVQDQGLNTYKLDATFDSSISQLKDLLNAYCDETEKTPGAAYHGTISAAATVLPPDTYDDSLIGPSSHIAAGNDLEFLLHEKTQTMAIHQYSSGLLQYIYPAISDSMQQMLYQMIRRNIPSLNFLPAARSNDMLQLMGLPRIIVNSFHPSDLCLYYNASIEGAPINDSNEFVMIRKYCLIAYNPQNIPLSLNAYRSWTLIDSIHSGKEVFIAQPQYGHEMKGGHIYVPALTLDSSGAEKRNGQLVILKLMLKPGSKATLQKIYKASETIPKPSDFYFRLDGANEPVVIDKANKQFIFMGTDRTLAFTALTRSPDSTINYVYDFVISGPLIRYIAVRNNKTVVAGVYNKTTHQYQMKALGSELFSAATIHDGTVHAFLKDATADQISFRKFSFPF